MNAIFQKLHLNPHSKSLLFTNWREFCSFLGVKKHGFLDFFKNFFGREWENAFLKNFKNGVFLSKLYRLRRDFFKNHPKDPRIWGVSFWPVPLWLEGLQSSRLRRDFLFLAPFSQGIRAPFCLHLFSFSTSVRYFVFLKIPPFSHFNWAWLFNLCIL